MSLRIADGGFFDFLIILFVVALCLLLYLVFTQPWRE
jgi:hypothetical protein